MIESVRSRLLLILLPALLVATACRSSPPNQAGQTSRPSNESTAQPGPSPATASLAPVVSHPVSLQALMSKQFDGRDLKLGKVLARNGAYTRYFATYKSGDLTISGIMNVPAGNGPFPALVLAHGHIDPDVYTNGQGLRREQDFLARHGYVVLHTDYRNHAQSDKDPDAEMKLRLGYIEDAINAVLALQNSSLSYVDRERIGMVGRSMGGGVTLGTLVVKPGLVRAAVIFAPVSSDYVDNFNKWIRGGPGRRELAQRIIEAYGSPEANPGFWKNVSPVNFFDRVTEPIVVHHGTADETVPIEWSEKTLASLHAAGKTAELFKYPGEHHAFTFGWPESMDRTVQFLDARLKRN